MEYEFHPNGNVLKQSTFPSNNINPNANPIKPMLSNDSIIHENSTDSHDRNQISFVKKIISGEKLSRAEKSLLKVTMILGLGGLTLGYDIGVVAGGIEDISQRFSMSLNREGFFVASMALGSVIGSTFGGIISDYIGRWLTCQFQAILFLLGSLVIACGQNYSTVVLGRFIIGIAAAFASVASVPYLKEISPTRYRGRFQGAFEISVSGGILLSNVINIISSYNDINWRFVFGFPGTLVIAQILLLFLLPESPSFLSQKGKLEEATKALEMIYNDPELVENEMYNLRLENMRKSDGTFNTFYRITTMFRTLLGLVIGLVLLQSLCGGFIFAIFGTIIYENTGFSDKMSLIYNIVLSGIRLIVTIIAVFRIDSYSWGRRQLLIRGICIMILGYIGLVLTYLFHHQSTSRYFYLFNSSIIVSGYSLSLGIVTRIMQSELFPTIIRSRTMAITTFVQSLIQFAILLLFLKASNASSYGTVFLAFLIFSIIGFLFVYYLIPESLGRNPEQILKHAEERIHKCLGCFLVSSISKHSLHENLVGVKNPMDDEYSIYNIDSFTIPTIVEKYVPPSNADISKKSGFFTGRQKRADETNSHTIPARYAPDRNVVVGDDNDDVIIQ